MTYDAAALETPAAEPVVVKRKRVRKAPAAEPKPRKRAARKPPVKKPARKPRSKAKAMAGRSPSEKWTAPSGSAFPESALIHWIGRDGENPYRSPTRFEAVERVRKANSKTVAAFLKAGGSGAALSLACRQGYCRVGKAR